MTSRTKRTAQRTARPAWRLSTAPKIRPLDPDKPLAPFRVPALKAFDPCMPGQGAMDFDSDDPDALIYADDAAQEPAR